MYITYELTGVGSIHVYVAIKHVFILHQKTTIYIDKKTIMIKIIGQLSKRLQFAIGNMIYLYCHFSLSLITQF